jgi:hypothetical protein
MLDERVAGEVAAAKARHDRGKKAWRKTLSKRRRRRRNISKTYPIAIVFTRNA